jgi:hypothetical protein
MLHALGTPLPRARCVSTLSADGLAPCVYRLVNQMSGVQEKTCSEQGGRSAQCGGSAWESPGIGSAWCTIGCKTGCDVKAI